jgi:hypothetical protein
MSDCDSLISRLPKCELHVHDGQALARFDDALAGLDR